MTKKPRTIAFIPARYGSTRFPGKPLALITGVPMIQHVYERVCQAKRVNEVFVATDDRRIADAVANFGGKFVMTPVSLKSGTDRCALAARKIPVPLKRDDLVVNVQGDEPIISSVTIDAAVSELLKSRESVMSTAAVPIGNIETLFSQNTVKVVIDKNNDALYFSRNVIPSIRSVHQKDYLSHFRFLKHLGIYIYRFHFLQELTKLKETRLEMAEKLEQLRVLENGYKIKVAVVGDDTISVDVPSDLSAVEEFLSNHYKEGEGV